MHMYTRLDSRPGHAGAMAASKLSLNGTSADAPHSSSCLDSRLLEDREFSALPGPIHDLIIGNFDEILKNWVVEKSSVRLQENINAKLILFLCVDDRRQAVNVHHVLKSPERAVDFAEVLVGAIRVPLQVGLQKQLCGPLRTRAEASARRYPGGARSKNGNK